MGYFLENKVAAYTKETLMSKVTSKFPDIIDVELVKVKEVTTISYKCGHSSTVLLKDLLSRGNKSICRICNPAKNTKKTNERFLKEVAELTSDLEFLEEYIGVHETLRFKYRGCGHEHRVSPHNLLQQGVGLICRICNPVTPVNIKSNEQFLKEVVELTTDIEFIEEYKDSATPIRFRYRSCGHEHRVWPSSLLTQGRRLICRTCNPVGLKSNEQFLEEVANLTSDIEFLEEYKGKAISLPFRYKSCGHEYRVSPNAFLSQGHGLICRICNPVSTSIGERAIANLLSKYTAVETSNRTILEGLEIDIYLPQLNLGIEYNGEYWHSEAKKGRNYHLDKTKLAESKGIRLVHIFEHEWLQKQEIVKSRLLGMLQQNYKLGARLCTIRELTFSDVRSFLNENHLQGAGSSSSINLGLYHKDILVAVMTFSKPRFNSNYDYELIRYASLTGINIQGGASKLLKYFTNNYKGSIISYSDKRWSQGNLYTTIGFEFSHSSDPSYFYVKNNEILSRYKCQKHKLKELLPDLYKDELTETEIMTNAGFNKVFDCGNDVWIMPDRRADG